MIEGRTLITFGVLAFGTFYVGSMLLRHLRRRTRRTHSNHVRVREGDDLAGSSAERVAEERTASLEALQLKAVAGMAGAAGLILFLGFLAAPTWMLWVGIALAAVSVVVYGIAEGVKTWVFIKRHMRE